MKVSTTAIVLAAALGVSAHPSGHNHAHRNVHRSLEQRDFVMAERPPPPPPTTTSAPPKPTVKPQSKPKPQPATSSSSSKAAVGNKLAAASSSKPASSASSSGTSGAYKPFCGGNSKRATLGEIAYKGNTGASGSYGCNMMLVDSNAAGHYDYTASFSNASGDEQACVCWLKIGPTGGINGFFKGNNVLSFNIPAGGKQVVAAEKNTQGGCTCSAGSVPTTGFGEYAGTWVEFDFANESNGGWSGADASALVASSQGMKIPGLNVCSGGTCSTINPGGTGHNAYLKGMEAADGVGLNLAPGKVDLDITVGYSG